MDPTLAANNSASDVKKYVGNGKELCHKVYLLNKRKPDKKNVAGM